ncbi:hypothetical protein [Streptomyces sp. KL116D]|uniref:hypothetical protein n=1 Tax=Streptomyces sp. KL116D TaxID=3045152 RepID=UPI003558502C
MHDSGLPPRRRPLRALRGERELPQVQGVAERVVIDAVPRAAGDRGVDEQGLP